MSRQSILEIVISHQGANFKMRQEKEPYKKSLYEAAEKAVHVIKTVFDQDYN